MGLWVVPPAEWGKVRIYRTALGVSNCYTRSLVAIRKVVPFNAQNNPTYEAKIAIVVLFYTR